MKKVLFTAVAMLGLTAKFNAQTLGSGVTDIDGNFYQTVVIGNQEWMAENLRTTRYSNGDSITYILDNADWSNCVNTQIGAWCHVNNEITNDSNLGLFYNWYAATDPRNVCPTGWHLSTESDWNRLAIFIDSDADTFSIEDGTIISQISGGKLKSTAEGTWGPPNVGATDEYGFNAKGTNFRGAYGINYYWPLVRATNFWVPQDFSLTTAWVRTINNDETVLGRTLIGGNPVDDKSMGNSIRCVSNSFVCDNTTLINPAEILIQTGSTATVTASTSNPNPSYVWQSDLGQGFQTLSDLGNYTGTSTATLSLANVQLSEHNQAIRVISTSGECIDTSAVAVISILDTCITTIFDTSFVSVTDTLIINTLITGINTPNASNTIKVFPNPANTHISIDYGNFALMNGYELRIENSLGQQVFQTNITQQSDFLSLATWGGNGLYFVHIVDPQGNTIDIRKIVLQ